VLRTNYIGNKTIGGSKVKSRRKWIGFYGDDFTGSTDAMEALTLNGVKTILCLHPPDESLLHNERFREFQGIGIAGISRALTPKEMESELFPAFESLKKANVEVCHYKTCSTFDSTPEVGSIGKAIEIGLQIFQNQRFSPLIVGVPNLKRYTVFGNHFATMEDTTYRLDRHPIMSKHPMTPMDEADLRIHLSRQTTMEIDSMNVLELSGSNSEIDRILESKIKDDNKARVMLFDVLTQEMLTKIGNVLVNEAQNNTLFAVGSSGVEYALTAAWKESGQYDLSEPQWPSLSPAEPLLVVSGSCSLVTEKQIKYSLEHNFFGIKVESGELINPETKANTCLKIISEASEQLEKGIDVVIYTALGPDDSSIELTKDQLLKTGGKSTDTSKLLGEQLGKISKEVIKNTNIKRLLVAGGDTSGYVTKNLEIMAMEMIKPITPGAPLCKTYSANPIYDGLEITLKGGQMGSADFFVKVKNLT
jgi:3-oxoisoapionate kinase